MAHLITGYAGVEHIQASDDGAFNTGIIGSGKYVFNTGNKFEYEIVSNNLIKIKDGDLMNQGRHMNIPAGDVEECVIENGLQGVSRHDLIVMRYQKDVETGIESASLMVIKGTSSTSPSDPSYVTGNIYDGEVVDDFPLYRVRLNGLNIEGVDCLFEITPSIETLQVELEGAQSELENVQSKLEGLQNVMAPTFISPTSHNNITVPSATPTKVASITLTKGLWMLHAATRWAQSNSAKGVRVLNVSKKDTYDELTPANHNMYMSGIQDIRSASDTADVTHEAEGLIRVLDDEATYGLFLYQNSGSAITTAYNAFSAYRISKMAT